MEQTNGQNQENILLEISRGFPSVIDHHHSLGILDSTKLKSYLACPRSFFFEYILGWRMDRPNIHFVFGESWHQALEYLLLDGTYSDEAVWAAYEIFLKEFRKTFPDPLQDDIYFPKTADRAMRVLAMYAGHYKRDDSQVKVLHTEIAGVVPVMDDLWMNFRLDAIVQDSEGKIRGLEHKTASAWTQKVDQWLLDIQPNLYLHALNVYMGVENVHSIDMNITSFTKNKGTKGGKLASFERRVVRKSPSQMAAFFTDLELSIESLVGDYYRLRECAPSDLTLRAFPRNPGNCSSYNGCPFHDYCVAWGNPLPRASEPPPGWTVFRWDPSDRPAKTTIDLR